MFGVYTINLTDLQKRYFKKLTNKIITLLFLHRKKLEQGQVFMKTPFKKSCNLVLTWFNIYRLSFSRLKVNVQQSSDIFALPTSAKHVSQPEP